MKFIQTKVVAMAVVVFGLLGSPAVAQFGGLKKAVDKVSNTTDKVSAKLKDIELTEQEEVQIGEKISAKVREKYGVVQDPAIHRYVALVGATLARKSTRSNLAWHFIVLDTDGVNAFASPGGFVHITRGALALMKSESQLAGVLGHELEHVTNKHAIRAIQKSKLVQMAGNETSVSSNPQLLQRVVDEGYKVVLAGYGRAEELESDTLGIGLASKAGYAPKGLQEVLLTLTERNKGAETRQGLFASHPEMKERLQKLTAAIEKDKSGSSAVLSDRYAENVRYEPVAQTSIAVVEDGTQGLTNASECKDPKDKDCKDKEAKKKEEEKSQGQSRLSLSSLKNASAGKNESKQSASVTGSGGSRGVDVELQAKGGGNASVVAVALTDAAVLEFIQQGKLPV